MTTLVTHDGDLVEGDLLGRDNRFVLEVEIDGAVAEVFVDEPGRLTTVLVDGATVLCEPVDDPDRRTDYTAVAIDTGDVRVGVRAAYANDLFLAAFEQGLLPEFSGYDLVRREPPLPEHGRADALLEPTDGDGPERYVEVKSCTHGEDGVVKFPDAPTERGRRHLRALIDVVEDGGEATLVFSVQRPDCDVVRPFRDIDPEFADVLQGASEAGVDVRAFVVRFDPPDYVLVDPDVPVELV